MLSILRLQSSVDDWKSGGLLRAFLAELLGTMVLVFVGAGSTINTTGAPIVRIALAFGVTLLVVIWMLAHVSGGHINPAVSLGLLVGRRISALRAVVYWLAQFSGAALGGFLLKWLLPVQKAEIGVSAPGVGVTPAMAVMVELIITFVLVMTVFAVCDSKRIGFGAFGPLMIGLAVAACHLGFIPFTGASMNPARSFGPAVAFRDVKDLWIYFLGPLSGGVIAALVYEVVFVADASARRTVKWLVASDFDAVTYVEEEQLHIEREPIISDHTTNAREGDEDYDASNTIQQQDKY